MVVATVVVEIKVYFQAVSLPSFGAEITNLPEADPTNQMRLNVDTFTTVKMKDFVVVKDFNALIDLDKKAINIVLMVSNIVIV